MSDAFILRAGGGGGLSVNAAILHVQALKGSTITLYKNNVVVKVLGPEKSHINADDNTKADWYYSVSQNNYGTWTVIATLGIITASDTITINSNKQYDLLIQMTLYLYDNGDENTVVTGGWEAKRRYGSYLGTLTKNAGNMVLTGNDPMGNSAFAGIVNDISNLQSNYSTAYIETGSITSNDNGFVFLDNWNTQTIISSVKLSANTIKSLPIPSGSSVIAIYSNAGSVTIKMVWME